ncbi:hypothetical protein [Streptomyces sp. NPDC057740]|uniref:hypothetical protein n=1 Tax=Streptomyces sp. NPDC057740 TaxID=3346234 RepID=UPI0036BCDC4F
MTARPRVWPCHIQPDYGLGDAQRARIEALAVEAEARAEARRKRQKAERAELADRWGLDRYAQPAEDPAARREEVERLSAQRRRARAQADPFDRGRAAAIERARAEKRERRRREGWS